MKATSLQDLFQFEKHIEDASVDFLKSGTGVDCFPATGEDYLITPRLEVLLTMGGADLPNDSPIDSEPELGAEYLKFSATFEVAIVHDTAIEYNRENHLALVGSVRKELLRSASNWNTENLPFYRLKYLRPQGSSRETDADFHRTILSYEMKFVIHGDAFPGE